MAATYFPLKPRVDRLLVGRARETDLIYIYLALREDSRGRHSFREIGDFLAHPTKRIRGLAPECFRDYLTVVRTHVLIDIDGYDASVEEWAEVLKASLRLAGERGCSSALGLSYHQASSVLGRALSAELGSARRLTAEEERVCNQLGRFLFTKEIFTPDTLIDDLSYVLTENKILKSKSETLEMLQLSKEYICLFLISQMHACDIEVERGVFSPAELSITDNTIRVHVTVNTKTKKGEVAFSLPLFSMNCDPRAHCTDRLLESWRNYAGPLELDSDGVLDILEV